MSQEPCGGGFIERMAFALAERESDGSLRSLQQSSGIDFCSNDYLGLARSEKLRLEVERFVAPLSAVGSTGSRLISGNSAFAEDLEQRIAAHHRFPAALLFGSGYAANIGLLSATLTRHDTVLYDEFVHASIRDGIRLSYAKAYSFRHNDLNDLSRRLLNSPKALVVVESLYSMDGDAAPLRALADLCRDSDAAMVVDEAHANGVLGARGEGLVAAEGLQDSVLACVVTFGKALGSQGAAVLGSKTVREFLVNFSRPFVYSTAPSFSALALVAAGYSLIESCSEERAALRRAVQTFDRVAARMRLAVLPSSPLSPVRGIVVSGNERVCAYAQSLREKGYDVRPIRSPSVPAGMERVRICLHAFNSDQEIEGLLDACASELAGLAAAQPENARGI